MTQETRQLERKRGNCCWKCKNKATFGWSDGPGSWGDVEEKWGGKEKLVGNGETLEGNG